MKVGKRQQQGRGNKQKEICPSCGVEYLQPFYGNDQGLKKKGVYCPNKKCKYSKKDNIGEIKMTETEANDFLAQTVANVSNENNPGLNITPDDPRVQEHAKKLEECLEEMLKWKEKKVA